MAMNYTDEEYHQYTLEEFYSVEVKPNLFAVSRIFAEAHKQMNLAEYKAFTLALSHIDWTKDCPDTLYLDFRSRSFKPRLGKSYRSNAKA